jgi:predicted DsbA family dithiol-disulfide isomerase
MNPEKMKVEIWSDVMCPFCYIGKRRFEKALDQLPGKENIEVIWKSFQLNPDLKTDPTKNINQYLSEVKGMSMERAAQLNQQVTAMAAGEGLHYELDKAIVANSMVAHRFSHFALSKNKQNEAEELLFKAYFTEGKNTDDINILINLGKSIGLDDIELRKVLRATVIQKMCEWIFMKVSSLAFGVFLFLYSTANMLFRGHRKPLFSCKIWRNPLGNGSRSIRLPAYRLRKELFASLIGECE